MAGIVLHLLGDCFFDLAAQLMQAKNLSLIHILGASAGGQDEDARFTCAAQDGYRFVRNRAVVPQQRLILIKRNGANAWLQL